jgi:hypothetical protein
LDDIDTSDDAKDFLDSSLQFNVEHWISTPELVDHKFLRYGRCPKTLLDTAFDVAPTLEEEAVQDGAAKDETTKGLAVEGVAVEGVVADKHQRNSDGGTEKAGARERKRRRAEKETAKDPKGVEKDQDQDQDQEEYNVQTTRDEIRRFKQNRRAWQVQLQADLERIRMAQAKMQQDEEEFRDVLGSVFDEVNTCSSSSSSGSTDDHSSSSSSGNRDNKQNDDNDPSSSPSSPAPSLS